MLNPRDKFPPSQWEGNGPLSGLLLKGSNCKGEFVSGGYKWAVIPDKYGNPWIVLVANMDGSPVYDTSKWFADPNDGRLARVDQNANALWQSLDAQNMAQQGWTDGGNASSLVIGTEASQFADQFVGLNGAFEPNDSDSLHETYVSNVPFFLAAAASEYFDGHMLLTVNTRTRTAVITGPSNPEAAHGAYVETIVSTVLQSLLAIVSLVVGVVMIASGAGIAAGIVAILGSVVALVELWYHFGKYIQGRDKAFDSLGMALAGKGQVIGVQSGHAPIGSIDLNTFAGMLAPGTSGDSIYEQMNRAVIARQKAEQEAAKKSGRNTLILVALALLWIS